MNESDRIPPEVRGLQGGVDAPDLCGAILSEVDRRRGWLSRRQRVLVCVARWGVASVVLGVGAGVLLVQRYTPVDEAVVPQKRALGDLMQSVRNETSMAVQTVSTQVRSLPEQFMNQSRQMVAFTARIERAGKTRTIELVGPAMVVDEATGNVGHVRMVAGAEGEPANREVVWRTLDGRVRAGVGLSWPGSLSAPLDDEPRAPLFEAQGLERAK